MIAIEQPIRKHGQSLSSLEVSAVLSAFKC